MTATSSQPTRPAPAITGAETMNTVVPDRPAEPTAPGPLTDANLSVRKASTTAGLALLVMSALSGFGYIVAVKGLVTQGNAALTAKDIIGSETLFRLGILSLFLVVALDVVVAVPFTACSAQ